MGKKRVIQKNEDVKEGKEGMSEKPRDVAGETRPQERRTNEREVRVAQRFAEGIVHIQATYNNTIIAITDSQGNAVVWSSAGSLGFSGAKKATPFAAARVAEHVAEKAKKVGLQQVRVLIKGVGSGRDSAIRALANHGLNIVSVRDITPVPHNGPRSKKPRRV